MKKIFITLDTEEDNQWNVNTASSTTINARFIPRFQTLCEKYGMIPIYFTTYGMACDDFFSKYFYNLTKQGKCDIGMHLHAWDTPPFYDLKMSFPHRPYLIEYPVDVMEEKIKRITSKLENTFQKKILSHRAGRWAINDTYLSLLYKYGYRIDSSVTPGVNWKRTTGATGVPGTDYSEYSQSSYFIFKDMLEMPVSIRKLRPNEMTFPKGVGHFLRLLRNNIFGKKIWLRPENSRFSLKNMCRLTDCILNENSSDCLIFMIHTSELMPGCNPNFIKSEDIEFLYKILESLFAFLAERTEPITLSDYYKMKIKTFFNGY